MSASTLLEVDDLEVAYRAGGIRKHVVEVLRGVSLSIDAGETVGLVGESGSGKSTLGRAILGLAPVTGGEIRLGGQTLVGLKPGERRRRCGRAGDLPGPLFVAEPVDVDREHAQ